ncbi:Vacuolar protein sorting-associated protein 11 homolog [Geodia barretti]|uniref:Vacuolar protein sorting-associated protein 11 homolog n=1 Tax=Geodia barretti TaxID=519541 RepID=A0AA35SLL5_GEOBA|nr:Vacuolar protein sorting-associated protein 11 homolog [Geodia barretti]
MSWRIFKFFESEELKDPDSTNSFHSLLSRPNCGITCFTCGRGQMVLGDSQGSLHVLTSFSDILSTSAYLLRVSLVYQMRQRNVIITVGDDEDLMPIIRVWNYEKLTKEGIPTLSRSIPALIPNGRQSSVMVVCAHESMTLMAVGFKDGTVVTVRGNLMRDRLSTMKVVHSESTPGVYATGLGFRQVKNRTILLISTSDAVYTVDLTLKTETKLDSIGCELGCSTMTDHTQDYKFVIARSEAVYFYTPEGRAQAFAFEGEKVLLRWYRGYLISVVYGARGSSARAAAKSGAKDVMTVSVYDIQNQFVAYQMTLNGRVVDVVSEWGSLYILLRDGRLIRLEENDTKTKLETLFKKNLYPTAINLARSQSYNDGLIDIFTQYGDHLYSKGDFDGAIEQYILTIGKLEPSYVIRKFLDAQRIHNLTDYLKALHKKGIANADHTTLLLNCYTKLRDIDQLDAFVTESHSPTFDVSTAIHVCRQANYHRHALALAKKYKKHDSYLLIQLEDLHDCDDAMEYIARLKFRDAEASMIKYGKLLLTELPDDTTRLLQNLCTDWLPRGQTPRPEDVVPDWSDPALYIELFVNHRHHLTVFLEHQISTHTSGNLRDVIFTTLLELYLAEIGACRTPEERTAKEKRALELMQRKNATFDLDHALVLAQIHDFKSGILFLYEKAGLFQQILQYHMEHNDYQSVMATCKRHGRKDPNLWVQALSFFSSRRECKGQIPEVLQHIDEDQLMPPLMVIQTLADSQFSTLSDIKPYIVKHLQKENEQIAKDEQSIRQYRDETGRIRENVKELQTSAKIFQMMKCSLCRRGLSLPAIHFLCKHSFHQDCLQDELEHECPLCYRDNRKVLDIIQRQEQTAGLHEQFHSQLQRSPDGFSVVAEYFGRGVFNKRSSSKSPGSSVEQRKA